MKSSHVKLRPLRESDIPRWLAWMRSPEVQQWITHTPQTVTGLRQLLRHWRACDRHGVVGARAYAIIADGKHVGNVKLSRHSDNPHACEIGLLIGSQANRGKGYGTAAIQKAVALAKRRKFRTVVAGIDAFNGPSRRVFEKAGFELTPRAFWAIRRTGVKS